MAKLLSIIILILTVILFPPASLALVSNNAVLGDATYPIKRGLEDVIYTIVSLHPISKAWFAAARSDRRFKEFSILIAQGKSASDTLDELVAQTHIAAEQLKKIDDPVKKQELISQLSQSIDKYNQKLEEVTTPILPTVSPPTGITSPGPTATPRSTLTPQPSEASRPAPSPTLAPTQLPVDQEEIDDAREKLEDIKERLEKEEKKSHQEKREDKREDRKNERSEKDKEKSNKDSDHDKKRD